QRESTTNSTLRWDSLHLAKLIMKPGKDCRFTKGEPISAFDFRRAASSARRQRGSRIQGTRLLASAHRSATSIWLRKRAQLVAASRQQGTRAEAEDIRIYSCRVWSRSLHASRRRVRFSNRSTRMTFTLS